MNYKYRYNLMQIVDEYGDLKQVAEYKTDMPLQVGSQIGVLVENNCGELVKRLYFEVVHIIQFSKMGEIGEINQLDKVLPEAQVKLLIDEPIK